MTKKQTTLAIQNSPSSVWASPLQRLESLRCIQRLAEIYSQLTEEQISARRTLHLLHAQLALVLLLLFGGSSVGMAALFTAWTTLAIRQCAPRNPA